MMISSIIKRRTTYYLGRNIINKERLNGEISKFNNIKINNFYRNYSQHKVSFAFDIDGVLLLGKEPIKGAKESIRLLRKEKIPFILLTNGGGVTESERANVVSEALGEKINSEDIILSHTPISEIVKPNTLVRKRNGDEKDLRPIRVLIVGGEGAKCRQVGLSYGYTDIVLPMDIMASCPSVWPYSRFTYEELNSSNSPAMPREFWDFNAGPHINISKNKPDPDSGVIDAILVFNDPRDWGQDTQIVMDILLSDGGKIGTLSNNFKKGNNLKESKELFKHTPIYFCNDDLVFATEYVLPRFGQGAFREIIHALYKKFTNGLILNDTVLGKPSLITYKFADKVLKRKHESLGYSNSNDHCKIFMVGDNPMSDIAGANNFGWESVLVKTGVFKGNSKDDLIRNSLPVPTIIQDNVFDAVKWGIDHYKD